MATGIESNKGISAPVTDSLATEIGRRISQIRGDTPQSGFAKSLGIHKNTLIRYEKGERLPDAEFVLKMHLVYKISPLWLLTGQGVIRRSHESIKSQLEEAKGTRLGDIDKSEFALVPFYDVGVSAGHGAYIEQEPVKAQIAFRRDWLSQNGFNVHNLMSLTARGDSMEPAIGDGDLLLVDTSQRDVVEDGIYILKMNNRLLAKRLQRLFDGTIVIKSDNPAYERQVVPPSAANQLEVIGRVVWAGRKM